MKKKKVLIFTSREGHLSIAQAAEVALRKAGFQTQMVDFWSWASAFKLIYPFYRFFPTLFRLPHELSQTEPILKRINRYCLKLFEKEVKRSLKLHQPDLIVSTHFVYNPAIAKVLDYQKTPTPFLNIVPDPWNPLAFQFGHEADLHLVYDQKMVKMMRRQLPQEKMRPIGWLTRPSFFQKQDITQIRKKLGFEKGVFTLLICGGSEGMNMILKILPSLLISRQPLQVMVVCGSNKALYKSLVGFKRLIERSRKKRPLAKRRAGELNLKIFGFTDQLPQLMAVADLIAGKAGPNLLFESVAAGRAFLAICHLAGHEDANLSLIKKKGLGLVEENPVRVTRLLQKIINHPQILTRFERPIEKERQQNLQASQKLLQAVQSLLTVNRGHAV